MFSAALEFQKGNKGDMTHYKELSDNSKWYTWKWHLHSTAVVHGISHLLDPTYVPQTDEERALFKEQQNFAYSVFERCLKTAKSMKFVREFEASHDAQVLYIQLVDDYEKGVKAELNEDKIED